MVLSATRRVVSRRARSALSGRCLKPEPSIDRQPDVGRFQAGLPCSAVLSCAQRRSCHRLPDAAAAPAWLGVHEDHVGLRAERAGAGLRAHRAVIADRSKQSDGGRRRSQKSANTSGGSSIAGPASIAADHRRDRLRLPRREVVDEPAAPRGRCEDVNHPGLGVRQQRGERVLGHVPARRCLSHVWS